MLRFKSLSLEVAILTFVIILVSSVSHILGGGDLDYHLFTSILLVMVPKFTHPVKFVLRFFGSYYSG